MSADIDNAARMSKYARKKAAQAEREAKAESRRALLFHRLNVIEHPELKPKPKAPPPPPTPPTRSKLNDLGDRPQRISRLLEEAADFIASASELVAECYELSNPGLQRGQVFGIRDSIICAKERIAAAAARAALIPNFTAPSGGEPEALESRRQQFNAQCTGE